MIVCTVKAIVGWFVLGIVGSNVLGYLVRGFFTLSLAELDPELDPAVARIVRGALRTNAILTVVFAIITALYQYALARFWNGAVAVAATMLMLARLPDLLASIRTGRRHEHTSNIAVSTASTVLMFAALPVLWWALC
jgi:hypothetical protein